MTPYALEIDQRRARVWRCRKAVRCAAEHFKGQGRPIMQTLTYRNADDWQPHHIADYLRIVTKHFQRRGLPFHRVWVAELQERGAVHYHVVVWLPRRAWLPKADREGWWPHGSTNNSSSRKPVRDATAYVVKYASKLDTKEHSFPKGLRMHGCGGLERAQREQKSHHMLPGWIREQTAPEHMIRRCPGGGFFSPITGEHFLSPWILETILFRLGVGPLVYVSRFE